MNTDAGARSRHACILGTVLLATLLAATLLYPYSVRAATGPWSPPVEISGELGGWFPDVAVDHAGNVHVVWNAVLPDAPPLDASTVPLRLQPDAGSSALRPLQTLTSAVYYARWDGANWTSPNDIALLWQGYAARTSLVADRTGRLHLIHKSVGSLASALGMSDMRAAEDLWYSSADGRQAELVSAWSDPSLVTRSRQGYFSDIAIDSRGVLHAIWTESSGGSYGLYYASSADGGVTWLGRVALEGNRPMWWYRAQLQVDGQDRLHAVWELLRPAGNFGTTGGALYATSADGGRTWSSRRVSPDTTDARPLYDEPGSEAQQPAVGIDGSGRVLLVFRHQVGARIMYQQSVDGVNWSASEPIPGVRVGVARPYDVYDMVTDSAGHVHLVMVGYLPNSPTMSLLHSEWDGEKWGAPTVIAGAPPFPEYPRLAISGGNRLHVVWFGGSIAGIDRDPTGIWYSTALTTAPGAEEQPSPASAVAPTPPSLLVAPSQTRLPSIAPYRDQAARPSLPVTTDQSERSPGWLSDLQRHHSYPLMVALAPVTFLLALALPARLGLFAAVSRRWRGGQGSTQAARHGGEACPK